MRFPNKIQILLMVAFVSCTSQVCGLGEPPVSSGISDYPPAWKRIFAAWRQIEESEYEETGSYVATVVSEYRQVGGEAIRRATVVYIVRTKPGHKYLTVSVGKEEESVYARTPNYAFALKRREQENHWTLVTFTKDSTSDDARRSEENLPGGLKLSVLYPLGTVRPDARGSRFMYTDEVKKNIADLKLVDGEKPRLDFTFNTISHISMEMDPAPYYIVRKVDLRTDLKPVPRRSTFVRELLSDAKRPNSSLPLCKSVAYKLVDDTPEAKLLTAVRITFSDYSFDPPPDDIFRLGHYGLPETLTASGTAKEKRWLWLFVAAGVCAALAVLFRLLARHWARRNAERPSTQESV